MGRAKPNEKKMKIGLKNSVSTLELLEIPDIVFMNELLQNIVTKSLFYIVLSQQEHIIHIK